MQWIHKVKIHPKMIHNRPPLNCQKCQFRFFTDQGLERHLLGAHGLVTSSMQEAANRGQDGGRCPICGKVGRRQPFLFFFSLACLRYFSIRGAPFSVRHLATGCTAARHEPEEGRHLAAECETTHRHLAAAYSTTRREPGPASSGRLCNYDVGTKTKTKKTNNCDFGALCR